ncbi:MAG TPA: MMPL family transporter [Solirubrobacteraceae bacterium]|nr:MMPL family transporter [Solirubrobacteraceae bacterium]
MSLHPPSTPRPDGALARGVRRVAGVAAARPKTAIALWLVLVVGCIVAGGLSGTRSMTDAEAGAGESARADERIAASGLADPAVESILLRSADSRQTADAAADLERRLGTGRDVADVQGPAEAPELSTAGGRTVLLQARLRGDPDNAADRADGVAATVRAVRAAHPGVTLLQAGDGSFDSAITTMVEEDLQRAELISLPVTLIILIVAFGALVAACVPLVLGITAVAAAMGALGVVSQIAPTGDTTASVVVLVGLAVGVDYSLFYIRREREERRAGRGPAAALDAASATVGRAILVSGLTVMVALAGLLLSGSAVFVSIGLATVLVVAIAVLGSLTVLPAMLALLGDRIDRGRLPRRLRRRPRPAGATAWGRIAGAVTRRPLASLVTAVCLLGTLALPALDLNTNDAGISSLPQDMPIVQAQHAIERDFPGAPSMAQLVVTGEGLDSKRAELDELGARAAAAVGGKAAVRVDVARDGRTAIVAVPMSAAGPDAERQAVDVLRDRVAPTGPGTETLVTGDAAGSADFAHQLAKATPIVIGFVLALAFALLLWAFRSPRLAATVVGLNLLSVGASFGVLVAVFQHSWAEDLLGFTSSGTIVSWLPLFSFVILFGLSMDYTVLVLERIREARRAGRAPAAAAAEGVAATAGTVTSAAVVMVAIFAVFATLRLLDMKQMGVGLAAAVLLDVTIVRGLALPAAITLLGERGWRVPRRAAAPLEPRVKVPA